MLISFTSTNGISPSPSLTEVSGLFRTLRARLGELENLARQIELMEEELYSFSTAYYARVLPLTARLERLRYRKAHGVFPNRALLLDLTANRPSREHNPAAKRKKSLFRSLAKRCHPDNPASSSSIDISEVYAAGTLQELWLLEIRCSCDQLASNEAMNSYLAQQQEAVAETLQAASAYKELLTGSDMWKLKERVLNAALQGEDLVEQIQCRIENQIAALQQYFGKPRNFQEVA